MAPHSSTLAWKIPWTEKPGGLQSMGSRGVRHDWATSLSLFTFMHWRRQWQPTPVFLPGESQGQGSLVGCCLWGGTESDTTEATQQQQQQGSRLKYYLYIINLESRFQTSLSITCSGLRLLEMQSISSCIHCVIIVSFFIQWLPFFCFNAEPNFFLI